ncbi:MAG: DNA-binding protein [Thermoanaerobacteraceae bacterium]|nr:DNA-binding protein [Thermoanaerobacteraceae bacterium]
MQSVQQGRILMGRVPHDADLLQWLTHFVQENHIRLGEISLIGAVKKAVLGYYHQDRQEYEQLVIDMPLEIANGTGNVSLKDGKPFVHLHVTLADDRGTAFGGHVAEGTRVFACEVIIREFTGTELSRHKDETTGLTLWK